MKRNISIAFVICFITIYKANSQSFNYLQESLKISTFLKSLGNDTVQFTLDANGIPKPVDPIKIDKFKNLIQSMANKFKKTTQEIETEFNYLLFLKWDKNPDDFKKAALNFPNQFEIIESSEEVGLVNANLGSTSFSNIESNIIYGITDFVIKRAKQESVEIYLNEWYNKLNNDDIIQPLLPQTLSVFRAFNEDYSVNLSVYGDKWKSAFQEDLRNMPLQFQDEIYVDKVFQKAGIVNTTEITPVITGGSELVYKLYLKNNLVAILSEMTNRYLIDNKPAEFKKLIVLTNILLSIGGQMTDKNNTYQPVTISQLKAMDIDSWHILFELIYLRKYKDLNYVFNKENFDKFYYTFIVNPDVDRFVALFKQTMSIITAYQYMISGKSSIPTQNLTFDDTRKMFDISFQLIDNTEGYLNLFDPVPARDKAYVNNIKPIFSYLSQIGQGISTLQYAAVLSGSIAIINKIVSSVSTNSSEAGTLNQTIKNLQIYGSFMVNILSSKTGDDVETALNELIPTGSYNLKNSGSFTVSLSAFPGLFVGAENISKYTTDNKGVPITSKSKVTSTAYSSGVFLPIGIDFNCGHKAKTYTLGNEKYNSWGLLIQAIDLGAVLSYRLSTDQSENAAPNITFKQILSPGLAITHHFTNSPIIIGALANYSPGLRTVNQTENVYQSNSFRFGIFLAVDVTFFNINVKK